MSESPITPEQVQITKRYAGAFTKSAALKDHFADLAIDERMMTFMFAIMRDKIELGREVEQVPDNEPTPAHFYPLVMENLMELIPISTMAFQLMDRLSPAGFQMLMEGKEPNKEELDG